MDENRRFNVFVTPCIITKQFDRCIRVALGKVRVDDDREAIIAGSFSREGLLQMLADLESVQNPINLPSPEEVTVSARYMWAVVLKDGSSRQQYPVNQPEVPFAEIHLPDVEEFWIVPREHPDALPWYGLLASGGFVREHGVHGKFERLPLPCPVSEPWRWQYYRNNTIHFGVSAGQSEVLPPHIVQVLGWRIDDTIFEIGIEEDGNYQVYRMTPADDPRFHNFRQEELELPTLPLESRLTIAE